MRISKKTKTRKRIDFISFEPGTALIPGTEPVPQLSTHSVYACEDTTFIEIEFEEVRKIIEMSDEAKQANIRILQSSLNHYMRLEHMRSIPPMERVESFFEHYGHCAPYMNNTEIASFLDMSRTEYLKVLKERANK